MHSVVYTGHKGNDNILIFNHLHFDGTQQLPRFYCPVYKPRGEGREVRKKSKTFRLLNFLILEYATINWPHEEDRSKEKSVVRWHFEIVLLISLTNSGIIPTKFIRSNQGFQESKQLPPRGFLFSPSKFLFLPSRQKFCPSYFLLVPSYLSPSSELIFEESTAPHLQLVIFRWRVLWKHWGIDSPFTFPLVRTIRNLKVWQSFVILLPTNRMSEENLPGAWK